MWVLQRTKDSFGISFLAELIYYLLSVYFTWFEEPSGSTEITFPSSLATIAGNFLQEAEEMSP